MQSKPNFDMVVQLKSQNSSESKELVGDDSDMILCNALNAALGDFNSESTLNEIQGNFFGARLDRQSLQRCLTEDNVGFRQQN